MTVEEASVIIGNIPINGDECYSIPEYQQAKAMAIKALEQQPCDDCISRQEAILQVRRYGVGCFDAEEFSPEQCERFVIQKLNDLPPVAQKEKTEWIPVSERLPEESKRYMVTTKYNDVMTDFYTGETFLQGDDIIAWMPIPKPYEPQESEEI